MKKSVHISNHSCQSDETHKGKSTVLLDLETDQRNHSASSIESKLLFCKRDDFFKPSVAKSEKSNIIDKKPNISAVRESDVLGKVKNFLGVIAEANKSLQADAGEDKYDIEILNGNETELIEMDLMLGVADLHTPEAVAAAESAMSNYQPTISLAADDSSDGDDDDIDSNDDDDTDSDDVDDEDVKDRNSNSEDVGVSSDDGENMSKAVAESSSKAVGKQPVKKRAKIVELS